MKRQLNLTIDIDSRKVTKYNDLVKVGDTVDLQLTLLSKGTTIEIKQETVQLFFKKEDNKKVQQNVNINSNIISCTLDAQATTTVGKVIGEIIFTTTSNKVTSSSFLFEVEGSINHEILEESMDKVDILTDIQNSIVKANDTVEKYKNNIEPIIGTSESIAALAAIKKISEESKNSLDTSVNLSKGAKKDLDESNVQAAKNLDALGKLGDATDLAKDVKFLESKVLKNESTPIKTDSALTKLKDCAGGYVRNMQIKGRTLQNLLGTGCINRTITLKNSLNVNAILKSNTTYTLISTISNTSYSDTRYGLFWNIVIDGVIKYNDFGLEDKTTIVNKITTKSGETKLIGFGLNSNNSDDSHATYSGMLLEGDWTNKEIPEYFEGIKSVGEAEGNKISILTCGKNLWKGSNEIIIKQEGSTDNYKNIATPISNMLQVGKTYSLSCKTNKIAGDLLGAIVIRYGDNVISSAINNNYLTVTFTCNEKGKPWWFLVCSSYGSSNPNGIIKYYDFQLEEGTKSTTYEPYKEDKTEILLPSPHCGLPDGTSDIVDYEKNERIKNVGKYILDQNTDIAKDNELKNQNDTIAFYFFPNNKNIEYTSIISDKFMTAKIEDYRVNDVESVSCGRAIAIRILKSKLETVDVAGFKKWLQANPTTVYYQLATQVIEKLNIKDTLQAFENGYIQLDNAITPCTSLEYSTNIMSIVSRVVENQDRLIDRINRLEDLIITKIATNK
ncbi:hypothetical protein [Clostridium botulinum]|uniref:hypothetical protein n=1 Tax=Clostridium botulinum TaxID=1491 RepID=UPI0019689607|nr:hypothetical protein [Clostridium botulinum]MBN1050312.1 hypothetical protein [Clostridium botulinum]